MASPSPEEITQYLKDLEEGDEQAADRLLPHVYEDLKRIAQKLFQGQPSDHTLQPTALVHEAYFRLVRPDAAQWNGRRHFYRVAAIAMRQLLTTHARKRRSLKRGGERVRVLLEDPPSDGKDDSAVDLVALDEALTELQRLNPRYSKVVELRFLAGLTIEETAEAIGIAPRTVRQDWTFARAWLRRSLDASNAS
ncbi:MAG: sigma-70 family RNA polymerase sigma factor [Planctomycetota bacterium]